MVEHFHCGLVIVTEFFLSFYGPRRFTAGTILEWQCLCRVHFSILWHSLSTSHIIVVSYQLALSVFLYFSRQWPIVPHYEWLVGTQFGGCLIALWDWCSDHFVGFKMQFLDQKQFGFPFHKLSLHTYFRRLFARPHSLDSIKLGNISWSKLSKHTFSF